MQIVDKRKKEILAMVYPVKRNSISGKYKNKVENQKISLEKIKEYQPPLAKLDNVIDWEMFREPIETVLYVEPKLANSGCEAKFP
jgi:hypothetical protein